MLTVYGIPNCDTVKKALTALKENQIPYTFYDYKKQGISREKLASWLTQQPKEVLINRAGTTWKQLEDAQKSAVQDNESAINLMQQYPSVIKRPVIEADGQIIAVGWKAEQIAVVLS